MARARLVWASSTASTCSWPRRSRTSLFDNTDFYDQTAAFTWGLNAGVLFRIAERLDLNAQFGLRHVSGLSEVDSLVGTDLEDINNDSGRLTVPIVVGIRYRFK